MATEFETVIGLEVHTELSTDTKIFCGCTTQFGGEPNTHVCEICSGMPGTLPVVNKKVVEYAVRTGIATNCTITRYNKFDRKNYFYPDLPKAYQISQLYLPICQGGYIEINASAGGKKKVRIKEIHMEEDAGKLIHDPWEDCTLVDYNRCGVPLLEIVSEPDISDADEAVEYLSKLRDILRFIGVSDCKMQEGSLRADINLSVKPVGSDELGVRTEMKNMNSFKAISRAIESETERQIDVILEGGKVIQQTRRWDDNKGESFAMRSKEDAHDYKYFPEPDLPPLSISEEFIQSVKDNLPELPDAKKARYIEQMGLPEYDTQIICSSPALIRVFERTAEICGKPKIAANWVMGEMMKNLKENGIEADDISFNIDSLGKIINMLEKNKISRNNAKKVFKEVVLNDVDPDAFVKENSLEILTDNSAIESVINEVIASNTKSVEEYKSGKEKAIQFLVGQSMKALRGAAPAQEIIKLLKEKLG